VRSAGGNHHSQAGSLKLDHLGKAQGRLEIGDGVAVLTPG